MTNYVDIEKHLVAWTLAHASGVVGSGSRTKDDLAARLPFVRWVKIGGDDNRVTDYPVVDCDVFAAGRTQAWDLAFEIAEALKPRVRLTPGGPVLDFVRANPTPRELPWDNPKIVRVGMTFHLGLRG